MWTSWILSMNLATFDPHQHSNSRQNGFLATCSDLCEFKDWDGFFLQHVDDDEWSHLPLTKCLFGLQRHLLVLSVETSPSFLEDLPWVLRSLRVVPESSLSLLVSWKPVNPQECVWKNLYRNIMRTISPEKETIHYSITTWYTNLFLWWLKNRRNLKSFGVGQRSEKIWSDWWSKKRR